MPGYKPIVFAAWEAHPAGQFATLECCGDRLDVGEGSTAIASDFGVEASTINLIRRG